MHTICLKVFMIVKSVHRMCMNLKYIFGILFSLLACFFIKCTLQRHNTENLKQLYPEKELHGLSPNIHILVSVSDLYIPTIGLPILLQEYMWTSPGNT
jgi:hypothetical protein